MRKPAPVAPDVDAGASVAKLLGWARELASELNDDREKFYVLASAIVDNLTPADEDEGNSPAPTSLVLAKIIEDLASDCDRSNRLEDYLAAAAARCGAEASHG